MNDLYLFCSVGGQLRVWSVDNGYNGREWGAGVSVSAD